MDVLLCYLNILIPFGVSAHISYSLILICVCVCFVINGLGNLDTDVSSQEERFEFTRVT